MDACKVCGNPFKRHYRRAGERQVYCSKACRYQDSYVEKVCPTCGVTFRTNIISTRKDYCSVACIERSPCQLCGKIITGRATFQGGDRRFCSRQCAAIANTSLRGALNYTVRGMAATIRRLGYLACERCDDRVVEHLDVHHLDHNRAHNTDENLETICANCHAAEHRKGTPGRLQVVRVATLLALHDPI